ncbi:MAG TPA: hypothetical protein VF310_02485 [Vicinamibacteria bacterium]
MDGLRQDLHFALRALGRTPGFTAVVVATLALGIGANSAVFGLMDQVLLRPLPVTEPEQLVIFEAPGAFSGHTSSDSKIDPLSHPMFVGLRDRTSAFSGLLAYRAVDVHLAAGQDAQNAAGMLVSGTFFPVLGLQPALGRLLGPEDDQTLLVAVGVALGLPGGYGLGRLIETQLFGLSARDPLTFGLATSVLVLAALAAGYLPARRATRVDPLVALRCE